MSSIEDREKRSRTRKQNMYAKTIRTGELKGAFKVKVVDPRKEQYKRVHLKARDIVNNHDEEE